MVPQDISYQRLQSLQLVNSHFSTPDELLTWMGAAQAQDYTSALWSLGVRLPGSSVTDIEHAIEQAHIVRTWPMRGTLHFVPARDTQWMLKLMASKTIQADAGRRKNLAITDEQLAESLQIMTTALQGGRQLTRADLLQAIDNGGISTANQRGYHLLAYAAWSGLICLGPRQGKQPTFVLLNEWVPNSIELTHEEALTEIAVRYAQSHGPITVHDLARWTKLSVAECRKGLEQAHNRLKTIDIQGVTYWMQPDTPQVSSAARGAFLLPAFDEFVVGYKDRTAVLHTDHESKVVPGNNGMFLPLVVYDGQVIGVWKRTIAKKITVQIKPFTAVTSDKKQAVEAAAEQFAQFMNVPLHSVEWIREHY